MKQQIHIALFTSYLFVVGPKACPQDSLLKFAIDTLTFQTSSISLTRWQPEFNFIYHSPDSNDYNNYRENRDLINKTPTEKNHEEYYNLAASLWHLKRISQSEKMFLNIVSSKIKSYTSNYYHSSDVPGDTGTNSYGYGSFTSNYKNYACIYLAKIYIEKKNFQKALPYLDLAVKKYIVTYTCGTGYHRQQDEYDFLYAACNEGLGNNKKNIDMLLPEFYKWHNQILVRAIKKTYSKNAIKNYLLQAEKSISCSVDSLPLESYVTSNYGELNAKIDTVRYYAGTGTITLFNKKIDLPIPHLEDGEKLSRDYYLELFRESSFYTSLSNGK